MYVIVNHQLIDPPTAFERGKKLMARQDAPAGARVFQFFPSSDATTVTCVAGRVGRA